MAENRQSVFVLGIFIFIGYEGILWSEIFNRKGASIKKSPPPEQRGITDLNEPALILPGYEFSVLGGTSAFAIGRLDAAIGVGKCGFIELLQGQFKKLAAIAEMKDRRNKSLKINSSKGWTKTAF